MRRPLTLVLVLAAGAASPLLAGCGQDDSRLVPASDAAVIEARLDGVQTAVEQGSENCTSVAQEESRAARAAVRGLPAAVDNGLVDALLAGIQRLQDAIGTDCEASAAADEDTTTTTTPEDTTTETVPTVTETVPEVTETVPEETVPPAETPTVPTPEETTPAPVDPTATDPADPGDSGGVAPEDPTFTPDGTP